MNRPLFIVLLLASAGANAQSRIDHAYISETVNGGAPVGGTNQRAHVSMTELGLGTPPLKLANGVMILGSLYGRHLIFNGADPTGRRDGQNLDELTLGAVVLVPLSERWRLAVIPAVGMQSAFQTAFSGKDMVYTVVASASYRINGDPNFVVGGGVLVTNALGFAPALPIASLSYRHDPWRIDLIWPEPTAVYRIAHRVELGASFRFDYPSYRIQPFQTGNGETADYIRVTNHLAGAVVGVRLFANMWLLGKGGVNFGRIARLLKSGRHQIQDARLDLGAAPFASLVLSIRGPEVIPVAPQELDEGAQ